MLNCKNKYQSHHPAKPVALTVSVCADGSGCCCYIAHLPYRVRLPFLSCAICYSVTILRESGAYDTFSFLYWSLCCHSPQTVTPVVSPTFGKTDLNVLTVPLDNLFISSNLVKSEVSLGVCPVQPVTGYMLGHMCGVTFFSCCCFQAVCWRFQRTNKVSSFPILCSHSGPKLG